MGSFLGHVVPGTFFFLFSLWWLYNVLYRYFYSKRFRPKSYRNTTTFPCPCNQNAAIEAILKIVSACFGILGEFCTGFDNGKWTHWGNAQHITMFFFFGLNGVVDLCTHRKWDMPPKLDYVTAALAYAVEGFLFYYHLHGRSHMDIMVHMFLVYTIGACMISTLAEMMQPTNVLPALCRTFFTFLQGTWFYQVGFILYPPIGEKWDQDDHTQMMIVTLIFTWHMAAAFATMFGMGTLIWLRVQNLPGSTSMYQMVDTNEPQTPEKCYKNGHTPYDKSTSSINQILDSESEDV
ncbi:unnamed protein product [Orchesella dallaii]|uniref:Transmembrane protein 45B n=1 Tax=Orchesella dallaii TaxID=48710 RepID=A0ABP1PN47_9HEXA